MANASGEFEPNDPVGSFVSVWQRVILEPKTFFDTLPASGGLLGPLAFAAICLVIGAVEFLIFGGGIEGFFGLVLLGLARLFIGSAIFALVAQSLFDGKGDYEATFRAIGYSTAVAVAIGIPVIKYFAALYGLYLIIIGLARMHGFDTVRALSTTLSSLAVAWVIVYALGLGGCVASVNPLLR